MKFIMKLIKWLAIILIFFAAILFTVPFIFKAKLIELAKTEINKDINAQVDFGKFSLSFFTAFPNLNFVMHDLSIIGEGEFDGKKLAQIDKLELRMSLFSLNSDEFSIKSIHIDRPKIRIMMLKSGKANWDIAKKNDPQPSASQTTSKFKLNLEKVFIRAGEVNYNDEITGFSTSIKGFWGLLSGDITANMAHLNTDIKANDFSLNYKGINYIDQATLTVNGEVESNLTDSKFSFNQLETKLNELGFLINGMVEIMGDDIGLNLGIEADENEFKNFLSTIPSIYNEHFTDLHASGLMSIEANIKGVYNQQQMPGFNIMLNIMDAKFNYTNLPNAVEDVNIVLNVTNKDGEADHTIIDLSQFRLKIDNNPIDAQFKISNPINNPKVVGTLKGKLDLGNFKNTFPIDEIELSGLVTSNIKLNGSLSSLEEKSYTDFIAQGKINAENIFYKSNNLPEGFSINVAQLNLKPQQLNLIKLDGKFGRSNFSMNGIMNNYLAYFFKEEVLKGDFNLHSNSLDLNKLIENEETDTKSIKDPTTNTFEIPSNINFNLSLNIKKAFYKDTELTNIHGNIFIKEGKLELENVMMKLFQGQTSMNGFYETNSEKKAKIGLGLDLQEMDIKKTATTFNTLNILAPIAEKCSGKFSASIIYYNCLLNKNMMPELKSINAKGRIKSKNIRLENSEILNKISGLLKLGDLKSLDLKDIDLSFNINNGRVETEPFVAQFKNFKTTIQGIQDTDQSIDYLMQFSLPYEKLGDAGESVSGLLLKAKSSGLNFLKTDNVLINAKITGDINDPKIAFDLNTKNTVVLEAQKQANLLMEKAIVQADKINTIAKKTADQTRLEAETQAQKVEKKAEGKFKIFQIAAKKAADKIRSEGEKKAKKIEDIASEKAAAIIQKAKAEGDKLIDTAKKQ